MYYRKKRLSTNSRTPFVNQSCIEYRVRHRMGDGVLKLDSADHRGATRLYIVYAQVQIVITCMFVRSFEPG